MTAFLPGKMYWMSDIAHSFNEWWLDRQPMRMLLDHCQVKACQDSSGMKLWLKVDDMKRFGFYVCPYVPWLVSLRDILLPLLVTASFDIVPNGTPALSFRITVCLKLKRMPGPIPYQGIPTVSYHDLAAYMLSRCMYPEGLGTYLLVELQPVWWWRCQLCK